MNIDYIVVQAGGKGTRLEHLTRNKPKAIVPVHNLPMLFHLFKKYPDKRFVIIGDYKKEVLEKYLECFADVKYIVVPGEGTGTCAGIKNAIDVLPENTPFMLIWSDLILPENFDIPTGDKNYVGISQTFPCRWKYENGIFAEEPSTEYGVAGMFVFKEKSVLNDVPSSGELVRWFASRDIKFDTTGLAGTKEFGILAEYNKLEKDKCRPFNKTYIKDGRFVKEGIDAQGKQLAKRENAWYKLVKAKGFKAIPEIYGTDPLCMELINGKNIYEYSDISLDKKTKILENIVSAIKALHGLGSAPVDNFSVNEAYYKKTMGRLNKIRSLVPFADEKYIKINGKKCRNVFFFADEFRKRLSGYRCEKFALIHGDCTFSNLMLKNDSEPVLIDPRGYFGFTEVYGDPMYDWAKLYYSLVGNYDRFNLRDFSLEIGEDGVKLDIVSNGWEDTESRFIELTGVDADDLKLLHAVIWLSLTTYTWADYDSVCGAFYNGLYYLEEVL